MSSVVINFKTNSALKRRAQRQVEKLGLTLTGYLNAMLRKLDRIKNIDFIEEEGLELTDWAKEELRKSEEDIKAGRVISFESWEEEKAYLDKLITDARKRDKD